MGAQIISIKMPEPGYVDSRTVTVTLPATTSSEPASNEVRVYQAGTKLAATTITSVISSSQRRFYSTDASGGLVQQMSWESAPNKEQLQIKIEQAISGAKEMFEMDIMPMAITIKGGVISLAVQASDARNGKCVDGLIVIGDNKVCLTLPETYNRTGAIFNFGAEYSYNL